MALLFFNYLDMLRITLVLLLCALLVSCSKNNNQLPEKKNKRTVLMYMAAETADVMMWSDADQKLEAIAAGWNDEIEGTFIVYQDTRSKSSPRLLRITNEEDSGYELLKSYDEINSADPQEFSKVINEVISTYPADSYGLIVFSHGSGWLPEKTNSARSVMVDGTDEMELKDFAAAIPDNLFEYIIFEGCNMAGVEVVYELKEKAGYLMASVVPMASPGFQEIYTNGISYLFGKENDLVNFAKNYFNYWDNLAGEWRTATISLFNVKAINNLANVIQLIRKEVSGNIDISGLQTFDGYLESPYYFFDLEEYYHLIASVELRKALSNALNDLIIYTASTPNYTTNNAIHPINYYSGITTYIIQNDLDELNMAYKELEWYKAISE